MFSNAMERERLRSENWKSIVRERNVQLGVDAIERNLSSAAKSHGVSPQVAYYHRRKILDPSFHPGKWGGNRGKSFSAETVQVMEKFLWDQLHLDPTRSLDCFHSRLLLHLQQIGLSGPQSEVSVEYVRRIFKKWKWRYVFALHSWRTSRTLTDLSSASIQLAIGKSSSAPQVQRGKHGILRYLCARDQEVSRCAIEVFRRGSLRSCPYVCSTTNFLVRPFEDARLPCVSLENCIQIELGLPSANQLASSTLLLSRSDFLSPASSLWTSIVRHPSSAKAERIPTLLPTGAVSFESFSNLAFSNLVTS